MRERMAADYLSIGTTMLRERGPPPVKIGGRTLWDKGHLDRFADALSGYAGGSDDEAAIAADVERRWFADRAARKLPSESP